MEKEKGVSLEGFEISANPDGKNREITFTDREKFEIEREARINRGSSLGSYLVKLIHP